MPIEFKNPYRDLADKDLTRTNTDCAFLDYFLLRQFGRGTFTTTSNLLINELASKCRELGYTNFTKSDEYERLVLAACEYIRKYQPSEHSIAGTGGDALPTGSGRTSTLPHSTSPQPNDPGRDNGVPTRQKASSRKLADAKKRAK